jgi:hypothetical protein
VCASERAVPARLAQLANELPSHDTFSRLFRQLDPAQFAAAFQRFMAAFCKQVEGVVAIDGKMLRRSFDRASAKSPLQYHAEASANTSTFETVSQP